MRLFVESFLERFQLSLDLVRQAIPELGEELLDLGKLPAQGLGVDAEQLAQRSIVELQAFGVELALRAGSRPSGVSTVSPSPSQRRNTHSSTRLFSP